MAAMQRTVRESDLSLWARHFLDALHAA
jgi:hypothetical protein